MLDFLISQSNASALSAHVLTCIPVFCSNACLSALNMKLHGGACQFALLDDFFHDLSYSFYHKIQF